MATSISNTATDSNTEAKERRVLHIPTKWRVQGNIEDVYDILSAPKEFVRWWSDVYLDVEELVPGDENGVGRTLRLLTKGKLPYTLSWQAHALEINKPHRILIQAQGDLDGKGEWFLQQNGPWVDIRYDWTVYLSRPWMRLLTPLLKPVFIANHQWAMNKGKEGLQAELNRMAGVP